jgi:hypothetical protein
MRRPSFTSRPVDETFFDIAPFVLSGAFDIPRPAPQVWADLTADNRLAWRRILQGITWTSPRPFGVGTTRTVRSLAGASVLNERFFRWEEGRRKSFYVVESSVPLFPRSRRTTSWIPQLRRRVSSNGPSRSSRGRVRGLPTLLASGCWKPCFASRASTTDCAESIRAGPRDRRNQGSSQAAGASSPSSRNTDVVRSARISVAAGSSPVHRDCGGWSCPGPGKLPPVTT